MLQSVNPGPGDPLGNLASTETRTAFMFESANPGPGDPLGNLASTATWLDSRPDNGWRWLSDACNAGGWNALFVVASSWRTHSLRASKSSVVSSRWWNKGRYEWNVVGFARVHTTEKSLDVRQWVHPTISPSTFRLITHFKCRSLHLWHEVVGLPTGLLGSQCDAMRSMGLGLVSSKGWTFMVVFMSLCALNCMFRVLGEYEKIHWPFFGIFSGREISMCSCKFPAKS